MTSHVRMCMLERRQLNELSPSDITVSRPPTTKPFMVARSEQVLIQCWRSDVGFTGRTSPHLYRCVCAGEATTERPLTTSDIARPPTTKPFMVSRSEQVLIQCGQSDVGFTDRTSPHMYIILCVCWRGDN